MNLHRGTSRRQFIGTAATGAALLAARPLIAASGESIVRENAREGTTDWLLTQLPPVAENGGNDARWERRRGLEAYCSRTSVRAGERITVFVSVEPETSFTAEVFRLGYYGGKGGRRVHRVGPIQGIRQPEPMEGPRQLVQCRWKPSFELEIPHDWLSGVYLGKLTTTKDGYQSYFIFIVRDDRKADFLFQCSDTTWQAYNRWPAWRSLYDWEGKRWVTTPGADVSFDRPYSIYYNGLPSDFNPLTYGSGEFLLWELPLAYWMEKEGRDVTYISNLDTHADAAGLLRARAFLSVGHDEYWSRSMMTNVAAARDAGVHMAFLCGNSVDGEILFQADDLRRNDRVFRRKDTGDDDDFSDEEQLMGSTSYGVGAADWTCRAPDHWLFEGTGMKEGDVIPQLVGWEYHGPPLKDDPTLVVLASGKVREGRTPTEKTYASTIYSGPRGSIVFNAATCWWNMPLARPPGSMNPPGTDFSREDERVQRITRNLLNRCLK